MFFVYEYNLGFGAHHRAPEGRHAAAYSSGGAAVVAAVGLFGAGRLGSELLRAAREQGKERAYLWIKLFAATGIQIQALRYVTVEAVTDGYTVLRSNGAEQEVRFPECLRSELLDYARRRGRRSGPLFLTRNGDPVGRTAVTGAIRKLCPEAGVPEERGNPRSLRRLYQNTSREIYCNLERLAEQAINTLLETEQLSIGWRVEGVNAPSEMS